MLVVYADDDDLVRGVVTDVLLQEGIDIRACNGGNAAIRLCQELAPDAVLLDINMPELDGLETARRLRSDSRTKNLRLVALTGRGTRELREQAAQAGFDEFLVKPMSGPELATVLRR